MSWWRWVSKLVKCDFITLIIVSGDVGGGSSSIAFIVLAPMYYTFEAIKVKKIFYLLLIWLDLG